MIRDVQKSVDRGLFEERRRIEFCGFKGSSNPKWH